MEIQFNGNLRSSLKLDDPKFLVENFERISQDEELRKSLLSLCLEDKAYKCFRYLAKNGFNEIYSLSYGYALRFDNQEALNLINEFNLFDINGAKAKALLNITLNNADQVLFDKIKEKIEPDEDVLRYALSGKNMIAIDLYQKKGYKWDVLTPSKNPLIFIYEIYQTNKKEAIKLVLTSSQREEMLSFALKYFEDNNELEKFKRLLPKEHQE